MNSLFTQDSLNLIINTVAAMFAYQWLSWVISRIKAPSGNAIGKTAKAITMVLAKSLNVLRYALVFGIFAIQLHSLLTPAGPPSRADTALIAFWVFWANLLFVVMMFDLGLWNVDRLLKRT